jgi:hypothetical protein
MEGYSNLALIKEEDFNAMQRNASSKRLIPGVSSSKATTSKGRKASEATTVNVAEQRK